GRVDAGLSGEPDQAARAFAAVSHREHEHRRVELPEQLLQPFLGHAHHTEAGVSASRSAQVRSSAVQSRSKAAPASSLTPWRLRKWYRQRCRWARWPARARRPAAYTSHATSWAR